LKISKGTQGNLISKTKETLKKEILLIENRTDISDDDKAIRIIKIFSTTCAALAVQPIPFADIFVLTPIQAFMGTRIGAIRGVPVSDAKATDIIKEITGVVGLGLLAQQLVIGGYKTFIPFLGALTTIPIVYGMTYAIGKVIDVYFIKKSRNQNFDPEELKKIWEDTLKQKKTEGKEKRKDIWESRKEYEA
jgi:uncharacterized protein (DUF697 family)